MEQVRWHADNLETMTTHRASAIAYGQLGEYDKAIAHFALCEKTGEGFDGSDCAHKLKYTQLRQKEGNIAKIAERSTQIYGKINNWSLIDVDVVIVSRENNQRCAL